MEQKQLQLSEKTQALIAGVKKYFYGRIAIGSKFYSPDVKRLYNYNDFIRSMCGQGHVLLLEAGRLVKLTKNYDFPYD